MSQEALELLDEQELMLVDILDHVLNRGIVLSGEIIISVANVELIYLGLNVVLGSVESIDRVLQGSTRLSTSS
ncbi:MAG: gas vesicle protein [Acidobacteria bacterium]|nr:gas vesicle protein [Acidobacteriota bacterium]